MPKRIKQEARAWILSRIKDDGLPVAEAALEHGVREATIRKWLRATAPKGARRASELARLRLEHELLLEIIGRLLAGAKSRQPSPRHVEGPDTPFREAQEHVAM